MSDRLRSTPRRFARGRLSVAAAVVLVALALLAFVGPTVWPHGHTIARDIPTDLGPTWAHPFGTTRAGHDVLGQVMRGTQQSLRVGALAACLTSVIGTVWGVVAGWYGGWADAIMMRVVDVLLIVPALVVVLVLAGDREGANWVHVGLVIGIFGWSTTARIVRGVTLSLRTLPFVEAARSLGASDRAIMLRHVVPNLDGIIVVDAGITMVTAMMLEASLSFVGFGIVAPDVSLGGLVANGQTAAFTRPWLFYFPGGVLVLLGFAVITVSDGLRDALDPRVAAPGASVRTRTVPADDLSGDAAPAGR